MPWFHCGVITQATWPKSEKEVKYGKHTFVLMPPTKNTSASIHIEREKLNDVKGLTLINRLLSALSWKCNQPAINHYGWAGNPKPVPVPKSYKMPLGCELCDFFPSEVHEITNKRAKLAVALYREAMNMKYYSVPLQFLSYFKILNIFWNDKYKNGENELVKGLRDSLPDLKEKDCVERIKEIKKQDVPSAAEYLYKHGRCAVAHAFADPIVDPDDITDLHRLSKDMEIMRSLTAYLIKKKLGIEQSIFK